MKPKRCVDGVLRDDCVSCGCATGQQCAATSGACVQPRPGTNCTGGIASGTCVSGDPPLYCSQTGVIVDDCTLCGCANGTACNRQSGSCISAEGTILDITSPMNEDDVPATGTVFINGTAANLPGGANLVVDDPRFQLRLLERSTGRFSFANKSALPEGPITVRISARNSNGAEITGAVRTFNVGPAAVASEGPPLMLIAFGAGAVVLLLLILALAPGLLKRRPKLSLPLAAGDILLIEGSAGSRKEEFGLALLRQEIKKGKKAAIISFAPEREASVFTPDERQHIEQAKVEPEINEMALSISRLLAGKPDIAYFSVLQGVHPKYSIKEISSFLESTMRKLKAAGTTSLFVLDNDVLSPQDISTLEEFFDGVLEFDLRESAGRIRVFHRVKEFKLRKFSPEWAEYG